MFKYYDYDYNAMIGEGEYVDNLSQQLSVFENLLVDTKISFHIVIC